MFQTVEWSKAVLDIHKDDDNWSQSYQPPVRGGGVPETRKKRKTIFNKHVYYVLNMVQKIIQP